MLTELFKTQKRVEILNYVLYNNVSTVTEVSRETEVSKGLVSRFLKYLESSGLLENLENHISQRIVKKLKLSKFS